MVAVKERLSGSWLDVKSSPILGFKLCHRLLARLKGEKAVFLTLTYARREGETAEELYRRSSEERHVREFVGRLARQLGTKLTGRWICKLEFQRGGWVHWHLIVVGLSRIDHAKLSQAWGHGHCFIQRCTSTKVRYFAKYIAKGGNQNVPGWLYAFPSRSVKVVRVSPGFWGSSEVDPERKKWREEVAKEEAELLERLGEQDRAKYLAEKKARKPSQRGVPIGRRLEEGRGVVVRGPGKGKYTYRVFEGVDLCLFLVELAKRSAGCHGAEGGWLRYDGSWEAAEAAAEAACKHRTGEAGPEAGAPSDGSTPEGLHLSVTSNPRSRRAAIERRAQWERENSYHGWKPGEGPPVVVEWWEELEVLQEHWEEQRIKSDMCSESPEWVEVWTPGDRWIPKEVRKELGL